MDRFLASAKLDSHFRLIDPVNSNPFQETATRLTESGTQTALSPNSCAAFSFDESSYPNIVYLQYLDSRAAGGPLNAGEYATR